MNGRKVGMKVGNKRMSKVVGRGENSLGKSVRRYWDLKKCAMLNHVVC